MVGAIIGPVCVQVNALLLDNKNALTQLHYCIEIARSKIPERSVLPDQRFAGG